MKFTYKSKKETDKERAHIDVFKDDIFLGYIINESKSNFWPDNWYFVSKVNGIGTLSSKTLKELKGIIKLETA